MSLCGGGPTGDSVSNPPAPETYVVVGGSQMGGGRKVGELFAARSAPLRRTFASRLNVDGDRKSAGV
jgi:hypothetical protein